MLKISYTGITAMIMTIKTYLISVLIPPHKVPIPITQESDTI